MGEDFGAGMYCAEVDYLIESEWACTLEDVIWRRTKHGLRLNKAQQEVLSQYIAQKAHSLDSEGQAIDPVLASA